MSNITINIKNCGCGGGNSSGSGASGDWTIEPPFSEPGYPQLPAGPPDGFSSPPGTLADRQCKAAVWLYDLLEATVDTLGNTSSGALILSSIKGVASLPVGLKLQALIAGLIPTIFGLLNGPDPTDAAIFFFSTALAASVMAAVSETGTEYVTQPYFQDALPKIQAAQDDIICQLSKATDGVGAKLRGSNALLDAGLAPEQRVLVWGWIPPILLNLLFYTADWWPSFDDDYLAGITTTCCGDYVDGQAITPGSVQQCQASHYIIDQLIAAFQGASDELNSMNLSINPFYNDKSDIYNEIQQTLTIPDKIRDRAADYTSFVQNLTEIYYDQFTFTNLQISDPGFSGLADYMTTNKATLLANLQSAADQDAAYTSLYGSLETWIDANVTDTDYQTWMKQSVDAIIKPVTSRDDVMDLLFLQDSDLLGYAVGECNDSGAWTVAYGTIITEDGMTITIQSVYVSIAGDTPHHQVRFHVPVGYGDGILSVTVTDGVITNNNAASGYQGGYTDQNGSFVYINSGDDIITIMDGQCINEGGFCAIGTGDAGGFTVQLTFTPGC